MDLTLPAPWLSAASDRAMDALDDLSMLAMHWIVMLLHSKQDAR